jgi:predicted CopG family antitoxin
MKTVEISDETYNRIMKDNQGAPFEAMIWKLIRENDAADKAIHDIMGTMLAAATSKDSDEFKKRRQQMTEIDKEIASKREQQRK